MTTRRVTWMVTEKTTYSAVFEYADGEDLKRQLPIAEHDGHWEAQEVTSRYVVSVTGIDESDHTS